MRIVFTGGPCSGKTTVFNALSKISINNLNHPQVGRAIFYDELARYWLDLFEKHDMSKHPSQDRVFFQNFLEAMHVQNYVKADRAHRTVHPYHFYDRGLVDEVAYRRHFSENPNQYDQKIIDLIDKCQQTYKYDKVFFFPYWDEIYQCDDVRKEDNNEAQMIGGLIEGSYYGCNYLPENGNFFKVPFGTVEERVQFILDNI